MSGPTAVLTQSSSPLAGRVTNAESVENPETEVDSGQIGSQEEMELLDAGELSARQFYAQLDNDPLSLDWNGYETDGQEEVFDFSSDEEETAMNVE